MNTTNGHGPPPDRGERSDGNGRPDGTGADRPRPSPSPRPGPPPPGAPGAPGSPAPPPNGPPRGGPPPRYAQRPGPPAEPPPERPAAIDAPTVATPPSSPPPPPPGPPGGGPPSNGDGPDDGDDRGKDGGSGGSGPESGAHAATKAPSLQGLSKTLQRGAAISAIVLIVVKVVSFLQVLAVARLLSPAEVGIFTAGTVLANFMAEFSGGGLKNALIQREKDIDDAADTVFWATMVNGLLMGAFALAVSPLISRFFGGEQAGLITAITAGVVVIHSLTNVPDGLMQRQFNFKRRLIVDPSKAITFALVAVVFSALGFGVWALVIGLYSAEALALVLIWVLAKWRPGRGRPSIKLWREMAKIAAPLVIKGLGSRGRELAEAALVGRWLGEASLGAYRYGRRVATLPGEAILQIASYVLLPAFSRIVHDPVRMRRGFLRSVTLVWTATIPAALLLIAVGEHLVIVMLGPEWQGAGLVLVGMAGYGPGMALTAVGGETLTGAGRSQKINYVTATNIVVGLGSLILLIGPLGLLGVGMAVSLECLVGGALNIALALPFASVKAREMVWRLVPPMLAAALAGAAAFALEHSVFHSDRQSIPVGLLMLLADAVLFLAIYLVALRIVAPASSRELGSAFARLASMLRRRRGGAADAGPQPVDEMDEIDDEAITRRFTLYEEALATAPMSDFETMPMRAISDLPPRPVPIRVIPTDGPAEPPDRSGGGPPPGGPPPGGPPPDDRSSRPRPNRLGRPGRR